MTANEITQLLNRVHVGHCLEVLKGIPDKSVHACVASPPYWGLRDYGLPPVYWPAVSFSPMPGLPEITIPEQEERLGLEPDLWAYTGHMVAIFREVYRVLRPDGTLWLNLGDTYITSPPGNKGKFNSLGDGAYKRRQERQLSHGEDMQAIYQKPKDLKMKDLAGIPWRVAYALQADGWYLRSDCPWLKSNPLPESAKDRPGKAHEYVFLLSKSGRYYYDKEAVKKPGKDWGTRDRSNNTSHSGGTGLQPHSGLDDGNYSESGRNRRTNDWFMESLQAQIDYLTTIRDKGGLMLDEEGDPLALLVNPASYKAAHFATFSEKLITPMVLASTSEYGCCSSCGNPWKRTVEKRVADSTKPRPFAHTGNNDRNDTGRIYEETESVTTGWQPTCNCQAGVSPAVILDPFFGSGTTGEVAIKHRRNFIGIDANPTYAQELATERLNGTQIKMIS